MTTGRPRPAATALFLGGGTVGVPGTPRLSEFIRGLHAPGKSFQEPPREIPLGRRQTRRNAVTPTGPRCTLSLAVSFIVGRGNLGGRICFFITVFFCFFVLHLLVSKVSSILVHIEEKVAVPLISL